MPGSEVGMADEKRSRKKQPKRDISRAEKQAKKSQAMAAEAAALPRKRTAGRAAPRARLWDFYEQQVRGKLQQQFASRSARDSELKKIVLNVGMATRRKNQGARGRGAERPPSPASTRS